MIARHRVRILSRYKLKRIHALRGKRISQPDGVSRRDALIETDGAGVVVDRLGRVRVERPLIDIRPVRQFRREGVQKTLDERPFGGIARELWSAVHEQEHLELLVGLDAFEQQTNVRG